MSRRSDSFDEPKQEPKEKGRLKPEEYFRRFVERLSAIPRSDDLITSHLALVPRIAARMRKKSIYGLEPWWDGLSGEDKKNAAGGYGIVWEELTSAGFVGLLESLNRFDPSRGAFSTCADDDIKKAIRAEIRFLYDPVKKAGWSTSLTIVADEDADRDDPVFYDGAPDETLVVDGYENESLLQRLEMECKVEACTTLTPIERRIVEARLDEDYPTLRKLAADLDRSHQRVFQIEEVAFAKIAATQLPPSDLLRFSICPARPIDVWLDAITTNFDKPSRIWRLAMPGLPDLGREDHEPQPLRLCEPEVKERFRGSDKLLTRTFLVSPDGVVQHNHWTAPLHHKEEAKEKKELWRAPTKNPLWKPPPLRWRYKLGGVVKRYSYPVTFLSKDTPLARKPWATTRPLGFKGVTRPLVLRENRHTIFVTPSPAFVFIPGKPKRLRKTPRRFLQPHIDPFWPDLSRINTDENYQTQRAA